MSVENLLFEIGRGHVVAFNILNLGRYKLSANALGNAKFALELAYINSTVGLLEYSAKEILTTLAEGEEFLY